MKKILLVDDSYDFLQALANASSKHFETFTATGVTEAIIVLEKNEIDLICSDLYMHDGTGIDLLHEIKKKHRDIPFILLSGSDYNLDIKIAEHYGANFIHKGEFNLIKQIVTLIDNRKKPTE